MNNDVAVVSQEGLAPDGGAGFDRAVFNSLQSQIVVLDARGRIVAANEAWRRLDEEHGGSSARVGADYFEVCRRAVGADAAEAQAALAGMQAVLDGSLPCFALEYPCHAPDEERWFLMSVEPLFGHSAGIVVSHLNISERIRVEQELQQNENKYRLLVEHASDGIHTYDLDGHFLDVNSRLCEMLGYTRDEMLRLNVRDFMLAQDLAAAPIRFEDLRAGMTLITERRLRRKDGTLLPVEISGSMTETGKLQAIVRDISARKRAEEALLESNEFNRQIIASVREGIIVYDCELRYVVWNPYMEELTGLRADEVLGKSPFDLFPFLSEQGVEPLLLRALGGETVSPPDVAYSLPHPDRTGWTSARYSPLRDARGEIVGVLAVIHDITERKSAEAALKRAYEELEARVAERTVALAAANQVLQTEVAERQRTEKALRRSEEFNARIIESSSDCIKVLDLEGRLLYVNPNGQKLLEMCDFSRYVNSDWVSFWGDLEQQHARDAIARAKAGGVGAFQGFCPTTQGTPKWWDVVVTPITDAEGRVERLLSTSRDITERKRAEEARAEWMRQLVTAQEDERRRIARELHDHTGQHLTAIMLGLGSLTNSEPLPPRMLTRVGQLLNSVEQLGKELHRLAWELRPAVLDDLGLLVALSNYVDEWSERARIPADFHSRGVTRQRLPPQIETTAYRIAQEALTNIVRHAGARHVSVILEQRFDHLLVIVEDDGKGFDVEALRRVPVAERRLGVLGMQERVALVGGTLDIESAPGQGTTVFVRMPILIGMMEVSGDG